MQTLFSCPEAWQSKTITADGYHTHYIEAGNSEAQPLVLVHGGACEVGLGVSRWYPTVIPLAEHFHVIAIDQLGNGSTDAPRTLSDLGDVTVRAEHVIATIDAMGFERPVHLVGQSQGGWIAAYIAINRPDLVQQLVLIDSASASGATIKKEGAPAEPEMIDVDGARVTVDGSGHLPYFDEVFEPNSKLPKAGYSSTRDGLRKYLGVFVENKAMVTEEWLDKVLELSARWNALYMEHRGQAYWHEKKIAGHNAQYNINGKHLRELVHKITCPTLVIWGRNSNKGIDPGYAFYKTFPNADFHVFNNANHFLWLDQPEKFNRLLTWHLMAD